ncbi:MAG: M23 family peptidase, partial [Bacteroidota bacterium]|nr:M23 family peptidase [Bacteroidota bacterium]
FNVIKRFRAEVNGQWLRFTNDKGKTWIYSFDDKFPKGESELKVMVEDEAGNVTEKVWNVRK